MRCVELGGGIGEGCVELGGGIRMNYVLSWEVRDVVKLC